MPTPYIPPDVGTVTGSVNVQNRLDSTGALATYVIVRNVTAQFQLAHTTPMLVFQIDRTLIGQLTGGLVGASASAVTGSW